MEHSSLSKKRWLSNVLAGLTLSLLTTTALACSCVHYSLLQKWNSAEHVFIADVNRIETLEEPGEGAMSEGREHGFFEVVTTFKGSPDAITHFSAAHTPRCCVCSTKLKKQRYIVFASKEGELNLSLCSMTVPLSLNSYYPEVLSNLKSSLPPQTFSGIYNAFTETLLIEDEVEQTRVIHFSEALSYPKAYVVMKGYRLNDGQLFFMDVEKVIPLPSAN